ncbi:MAG: ribose-phosphate pyrophosphokinase [Sphingobacteriales bacterium]|nr:MAG: ribose-phosphate pyrophosphokinase [Sphingobacteriales bacterium]
MSSVILFSTKPYCYLLDKIKAGRPEAFEQGVIEEKSFPDGEYYHRICTDVRGRHVWIIGGTIDDAATLELFDLAQGCVQYGAFSLTIIIPYFGYSTMERITKPGEIVKAKNRALLFSSIPRTALGNKVILFDLHAEGIPYYFNSDIQPYHLHSSDIIADIARELGGEDFVLASTDAGRAKWIESLANFIHVPAAFVYKRRLSGTETEIQAVNANVSGRHVVIYDDMIRTGGSLISAAKAYSREGASAISVITTHGLFTDNAVEKIAATGLVRRLVCLDTHPNANQITHPLLEVRSITPLILKKLNYEGDLY